MDIYDAIAMTIYSNNGKIKGRTAIQKLVYFHTLKIPALDVASYRHYFYGPFSRDVASAMEDMSAFSYVNEIVHSGIYDSYLYEITQKGNQYAEKAIKEFPKEYEMISKTVKICNEFCNLKPAPLSFAAKSYYVLTSAEEGRKGQWTIQEVRNVAKNFDWDISEEDVETGIALLQKLGLVELS